MIYFHDVYEEMNA